MIHLHYNYNRPITRIASFQFPAGLDNVKINVTHRMNSTSFATINKLGSGLKKKSKKKKGKPGKVNDTVRALLVSQLCPFDYLYTRQKLKSPQPHPGGCYNIPTLCPAGSIHTPWIYSTVFPRGRKSYGISFRAEMGEIWSLCVAKRNDLEEI